MSRINLRLAIVTGGAAAVLLYLLPLVLGWHVSEVALGEFSILLIGLIILAVLPQLNEISSALTIVTILIGVAVFFSYVTISIQWLWLGAVGAIVVFQLGMLSLLPFKLAQSIAVVFGTLIFFARGLIPGAIIFVLFSVINFSHSTLPFALIGGAIIGIALSLIPSLLIHGVRKAIANTSKRGVTGLIPSSVVGALFGLWSGVRSLPLPADLTFSWVESSERIGLVIGVWLVVFGIVLGNLMIQLLQHERVLAAQSTEANT